MVTTRTLTLAEFEAMGDATEDFEVLGGVLVRREGMGERRGQVGYDLGFALGLVVKPNNLGQLYTSDTEFVLGRDPLDIVKPDIAFVRADRRTAEVRGDGPMHIPPDLVVEVVSPNDQERKVLDKIDRYRRAGVPLIWLVRPRQRTVTVYAAGREPFVVGEDGELDGGDVLPGFRLPVAAIFAER